MKTEPHKMRKKGSNNKVFATSQKEEARKKEGKKEKSINESKLERSERGRKRRKVQQDRRKAVFKEKSREKRNANPPTPVPQVTASGFITKDKEDKKKTKEARASSTQS